MKRAIGWSGKLHRLLKNYRYQPQLTPVLDKLGNVQFDQQTVNELVLWKVNRYSLLSPGALAALNRTAAIKPGEHWKAKTALTRLLGESGVDLAMASTFLRFRNPKTFQIIDRHAYRAVYGEDYPLSSTLGDDEKIKLYFKYLDQLIDLAKARSLKFRTLDRILYVFDKQENGQLG